MNGIKQIMTPLLREEAKQLRTGDKVEITGEIYTARDAAHKKLIEIQENEGELPFDLKDKLIYYVGPCPTPPGKTCGSAGPTTSGRMDAYTPQLLRAGLRGMIGKGTRSASVIAAMKECCAVYFAAVGGAGALISRSIISAETIAFPELGPEAVMKMAVDKFPAMVVIDCLGNNLYETGRLLYRRQDPSKAGRI